MTQVVPEEWKDQVYGVAAASDPTRWNVHPEFTYPQHGTFLLDLQTREPFPNLDFADKGQILKVKSVHEVNVSRSDISFNDYVMTLMSTKPCPQLLEAIKSGGFDSYPYIENDMPMTWGELPGPFLPPLLKKAETYQFLVTAPVRANLVKHISQLLRKPYYIVLRDIFITTKHLFFIRPLLGTQCKLCGKEAVMNLADMSMMGLCPECLQKAVFKRMTA